LGVAAGGAGEELKGRAPIATGRYMLSYDAVTFNSYLETIIASNSTTKGGAKQNQSPWLYLDAANVLFQTAKRRVYTMTRRTREESVASTVGEGDEDEWAALQEAEQSGGGDGREAVAAITPYHHGRNRTRSSWPKGVEPVLEELPKWGLLSQVLEEIETEITVAPMMDLSELVGDGVWVGGHFTP
jgi:DNA excision repair protein ERCC-4